MRQTVKEQIGEKPIKVSLILANHRAIPCRRRASHGACFALELPMTNLLLAPTRKYFGFGNFDDYVVLEGGRVVGRILLHPQGPEGRPWFWSITAMDHPPSVYNKGYSAAREQAMADVKARWLA
jgi:hypothetical protein